MMRIFRIVPVLLLLVASSVHAQAKPSTADARDSDHSHDVAWQAMSQLRSPVTPGHTLDMCPSAQAEALRDTVLMEAGTGKTADEIVEGVIARRGEQMRIVPKKSGTGLLAWIAPPFVLLIGAGGLIAFMRAMRRRGSTIAPAAAPLTAEDRAELEAELRQFERAEEVGA
jgi:cytochrome c-type biogenesis protein CcmH